MFPTPIQTTSPETQEFCNDYVARENYAFDQLIKSRIRRVGHYNKKVNDVKFKEGDMILLDNKNYRNRRKLPHQTESLIPKYEGQYEITKEIGNDTYRLVLPPGSKAENVFHSSLLKKYNPNNDELLLLRVHPKPAAVDPANEEYEIEKIVNSRRFGRGRRLQYMVEWLGWPESDNEWIDIGYLEQAAEKIADYHKQYPGSVGANITKIGVGSANGVDGGTIPKLRFVWRKTGGKKRVRFMKEA